MNRRPLIYRTTLGRALQRQMAALANTLRSSTLRQYRVVMRDFLGYLDRNFPQLRRADQLHRDPHILGWIADLTRRQPPLSSDSRLQRLLCVRRLLQDLADLPHPPRPGLIHASDLPRSDFRLPRPLSREDDQKLQLALAQAGDLHAQALLLQRGTGLRIGELADLARDCLHSLAADRWAIRVPLGKLHSERWVPVDASLRDLLARLAFLRSLPPADPDQPFLLPRPRGRTALLNDLRLRLQSVAQQAGCSIRPVSHQLRHTYATDMLHSGVSLIGVMKLLGHTTPRMTLYYVQVTQADLQREFLLARQHPRYQTPALPVPSGSAEHSFDGFLQSLRSSLYLLDCFRQHRAHPKSLDPLRRRLVKLLAFAENLTSKFR